MKGIIYVSIGEEENPKHSRLFSSQFGVCTRGDGRRANHTSSDVKYAPSCGLSAPTSPSRSRDLLQSI